MSLDIDNLNSSKNNLKKVIDIEIITSENGCRKIVGPSVMFSTAAATSHNNASEEDNTIVIKSLNNLAASSSTCNVPPFSCPESEIEKIMSKNCEQQDANVNLICSPEIGPQINDPKLNLDEIMEIEDSNSPTPLIILENECDANNARAPLTKLTSHEIQSIIHIGNPQQIDLKQQPSVQKKRKTRGNTMQNIKKVIKMEQTNNKMLLRDDDYNSGISSTESERERDSKKHNSSTDSTKDEHEWSEALNFIKLTGRDAFCWVCHKPITKLSGITCSSCPRAFHRACIQKKEENEQGDEEKVDYQCMECVDLSQKESFNNNKNVNPIFLKTLLLSVYTKIMGVAMDTPFAYPNEDKNYKAAIVNPMDTTKVYERIKSFHYKSLQRFLSDISWILHNSIIFYRNNKKIIKQAKDIVNICTQEIKDMKNCPTCYHNSTNATDWFVRPCPSPHMVVWARLKGFPFWPAKVMSSLPNGSLDVRFFGEHDRAAINKRDCLLFSNECPKAPTPRGLQRAGSLTNNLEIAVNEAYQYFENLVAIYGEYKLATVRCQFDPTKHGLKTYFMSFPTGGGSSKENEVAQNNENVLVESKLANNEKTDEKVVDEDSSKLLPPLKLKLSNLSQEAENEKTKRKLSKLDIRRSKRFPKTGSKLCRFVEPNPSTGSGQKSGKIRPLVIRLEQCRLKKSKKKKLLENQPLTLIKNELDVKENDQKPFIGQLLVENVVEHVKIETESTTTGNSNTKSTTATVKNTDNKNADKNNECADPSEMGSRDTRRARLAKFTKRKLNTNKINHANGDFDDEIPAAKRLLLTALNIRQAIRKPNKEVQTDEQLLRANKEEIISPPSTAQMATQTDADSEQHESSNEQVFSIMYKFLSSFDKNDAANCADSRQKIADTCDKIVNAVTRLNHHKCQCSCLKTMHSSPNGSSSSTSEYRNKVVNSFHEKFVARTAPLMRSIREIGEECIADEIMQMRSEYNRELFVAKEELYSTIGRIKREFLQRNDKQ